MTASELSQPFFLVQYGGHNNSIQSLSDLTVTGESCDHVKASRAIPSNPQIRPEMRPSRNITREIIGANRMKKFYLLYIVYKHTRCFFSKPKTLLHLSFSKLKRSNFPRSTIHVRHSIF